MSDASDAGVASVGSADPTTRPLRSTVMRSATASTSRSLWVMKTIDLPWSVRLSTTPKNSSTSPGVSTAVGSSRIRIDASRNSALTSSTRCCWPTDRSCTRASGSTVTPKSALRAAMRSRGVEVEQGTAAQLVAQHHVLGDRERLHQLEVLVDHADAVGDGVGRAPEAHGLALDDELAGVGLVEPEDHVHERRLAGAVLAQQAVDLAAAELEVDGVVGQDAREPLGDPAGGEDDVGRRFGRRDGGGTRHA